MATSDEREVNAAAARIASRFGGDPAGHALDLVRLAVEQGSTAADAIAGLRLIGAAIDELRQIEASLMDIARDSGSTWRTIADARRLGSQQSAQGRYKHLTGQIPSKADARYINLEDLVREITAETGADQVAMLDEAITVAAALGIRVERGRPTPLTATQARQIEGQVVASINQEK